MDSKSQFCPNAECPTAGQVGQGNIVIHSSKEARYKCKDCKKTFSETKGTAFYRLRSDAYFVSCMVSLMKRGCPPQAIVATYDFDERTIYNWFARGGEHCKEVHHDLVEQKNIDINQLQVDELCINIVREPEGKDDQQGQEAVTEQVGAEAMLSPMNEQSTTKGDDVAPPHTNEPSIAKADNHAWMAMAMVVTSRLWLGGSVSMHRNESLIMKLVQQVRNCAKSWNFLVCSDGLSMYATVFASVFSWLVFTGHPGRPNI